MELVWALGLSGDMDGVQASLISADGQRIEDTGTSLFLPYSDTLRRELLALQRTEFINTTPDDAISKLSEEVSGWFVQASRRVIDRTKKVPSVIGLYGQTVESRLGRKVIRLGSAEMLLSRLKIATVYDFHESDLQAGGNGVFLEAPYYQGLVKWARDRRLLPNYPKMAVIDVSDLARVTILSEKDPIAFEAGPGLALIDEFTQYAFQRNDTDGSMGGRGEINCSVLNQWMRANKSVPRPTSLCDISKFIPYTRDCHTIPPLNGVATLTAFVSQMVENAAAGYSDLKGAILTGRGAKNTFLKTLLNRSFNVFLPKDMSWNYQFEQSEEAAYNAVRVLYGLPTSYRTTTGVESVCGKIICNNKPGVCEC
ncbi:MAG: anhydro-N-acetylmuramic acid kinase [Holosporales bacterium]|nr:anhydro-N-acetylmuramic acid kinase [Holosporales bacterium]